MIPINIKRILTSPWTPIVALLIGLAAVFGLYRITTNQLTAARANNAAMASALESQRALLDSRDALIARQNAGIKAITEQRAADREAYVRNFAAASERARDHDDRAAQILAMPVEQLDELAQCRAAKALIQQEIVQ